MMKYPITKLHKSYTDNNYFLNHDILIDTFYALYFTKNINKPVWVTATGASGLGKSFLLKPFFRVVAADQQLLVDKKSDQVITPYQQYNAIILDQLTSQSFGSGKPGKEDDIGATLQKFKREDKGAFIYVPDMASIYYGTQDQTSLFAMFKTLFDGFTIRHTGSDNKIYYNKNVNFFGCATTSTEYDWMNVLGTRDIKFHLDIINKHQTQRSQVTQQNIDAVTKETRLFLEYNIQRLSELDAIEDTYSPYISYLASRIIPFRTETKFEINTGYFIEPLNPEKPMRLIGQLETITKGYQFIGLSHAKIIEHLTFLGESIGNKTRRVIYNKLKDLTNEQYKAGVDIDKLTATTRLSSTIIQYNLNILEEFGLINRREAIYTVPEPLISSPEDLFESEKKREYIPPEEDEIDSDKDRPEPQYPF